MPEFDAPTQTKIANLRTRRANGEAIETYELLKIAWPAPDGDIYYAATQVDEVASVAPSVSPIQTRIIPENNPAWFLPVAIDSTIGDEEIDIEMWDADEVISQLLVDHGEGVKVVTHYWFPQETLLLPVWEGHLRFEDEAAIDIIKLKAVQGLRSSDSNLPCRQHYQNCSAVFGGLFATAAEVAEHTDCPYDIQDLIDGTVGNNDPGTGLPWTYCDRRGPASCTARGVNPNFHLSHNTIVKTVLNQQTSGNNLFSTSQGNETNLKEPVVVIMGVRRKSEMRVMVFRRDFNNNNPDHAWWFAHYEGCEGPIQSFSQVVVRAGNVSQAAVALHYDYRLGTRGQGIVSDLTSHPYSGTAYIKYNLGWLNPGNVTPENAYASAVITGLNNIRVYSDETTYVEQWTNNRAWQLARMLCDKRWGYGLDYSRLNIDSFIETAAWCEQSVTFTDTFGTDWEHIRAQSDVELVGRKVQQQIEDFCAAGRISRPFLFNGKIHVVPLKALDAGELAACPEFTDEGTTGRNIVAEKINEFTWKSTLTVSRKSDLDLTNRVEITFDDSANDFYETPLAPIEDIDAQLAAGRVVGDNARKVNPKQYKLLGVVHESHAIKLAWSLLDLGRLDEGGLRNNLRLKFDIWFLDSLDLHVEKVIKVTSSRLTKYGFTYFRIKKMQRKNDLKVEIEAQAYNETYMDTFEVDNVDPPPQLCSVDSDCGPGYVCINGVCVAIEPPQCDLSFGTITEADGKLRIPIEPC